jgi:hypothetical protein
MEKLFSENELFEIENEASSNTGFYLNIVVSNGNFNKKNIITISKYKLLVFVEGNGDTGFEHIRNRHDSLSCINYWVESVKSNLKLDNPSKFHPVMSPIIDFVKIADCVFSEGNRNVAKNKNPDLFDMYTGTYCFADEQAAKYHLLTYKDTKIVHTLFPDKKTYNRKTKLDFGRGIVTTYLKFPEGYSDLIVPYEGSDGRVSYSILFRKFLTEQTERVYIRKHDDNGNPKDLFLIGRRDFIGMKSFDREDTFRFQTADFPSFETLIFKIENEKNSQS